MNSRLFLDMHIIQTLPPSNINRDDTGSPKTALYGGVRRARVSSQSWKAAMRKYFEYKGNEYKVGIRTRKIVEYIVEIIKKINDSYTDKEATNRATNVLEQAGIKIKEDNKVIYFFGEEQLENIAKVAASPEFKIEKISDNKKANEEYQKLLKDDFYIDIALFGRMIASERGLGVDASSQVAHAISTHGVQTEFDYFVAIDKQEGNSGAAMLGNIEYNSSTLYRYANIALHEFLEQAGNKDSMINATKLFVEAFTKSLPTGKVNTFANQTLPSILVINLREDRPVSLVSAFESPVKSEEGYVAGSIRRMSEEMVKVQKFVEKPIKTLYLAIDNVDIAGGEEVDSLDELLEKLGVEIGNYQFS